MNVVSSMADKVVHITTDSEEAASPSLPRTLLYTKRGLKMVGEEKGIFDLDEPKWDEDDRVRGGRGCESTNVRTVSAAGEV